MSMLTSQTSSSSATSLSSRNGESKKFKCKFPEKFKKSCVFSRKVFIEEASDEAVVTVIITSLCELIECVDDVVTNYINLKHQVECKLAKENISAEDVDFEVIFLDSGAVVYVLQINSVLFGIERLSTQLKLLKTLTKVKSFKYKLDEQGSQIVIQVTFVDNKQLLTSFVDDDLEDLIRNTESSQFSNIFESASQKTEAARSQLDNISNDIEKMDLMMHGNMKMLPKLMLADVSQSYLAN